MVVIFTPSRSVAPRKQVHIPPLEKKQSPYKLLWKVQGVICHGWVSPSKHRTVKIVNSHHPAFKLAFHRFLIARPRHAHSLAKILAKPLLPLHPTTVLLQLEPSLPPSLTTISHFHGISCRTVQFDDDQSSLEEKGRMSVVEAGGLHCSPFKIWWVLTSVDSMNKILCSAKLGNTFLTKTRCKGPQI